MYSILLRWYGVREYSVGETMDWLRTWAGRYGPNSVVDGDRVMKLAMNNPDARIFLSGTQGPLLDGDMGTIGNTVSYGVFLHDALKGAHLPVDVFSRVPGTVVIIKKAYVTRAGSGIFPGEFDAEKGGALAALGGEIGVTSGNIRRTGPDNLWETKMQVEMCVPGSTALAIPKVDVLGELMEERGPERPIVGYRKWSFCGQSNFSWRL